MPQTDYAGANLTAPIPGLTLPRTSEDDLARCHECSFPYFEEVKAVQLPKHHLVAPGQGLPATNDIMFRLLRCVRCQSLHEPNIQLSTHDRTRKAYDKFIEALSVPGAPLAATK